MDKVTVTLTAAQANIVLAALGVYLDVTEDPDDRIGYGVTGRERAVAERAYARINAAKREARHADNQFSRSG